MTGPGLPDVTFMWDPLTPDPDTLVPDSSVIFGPDRDNPLELPHGLLFCSEKDMGKARSLSVLGPTIGPDGDIFIWDPSRTHLKQFPTDVPAGFLIDMAASTWPHRHLDIDTVQDIDSTIDMLIAAVDADVPVLARIPASGVVDGLQALSRTNIDALIIDADIDLDSPPVLALFPRLDEILSGSIPYIVSAPVDSPWHIAAAVALGSRGFVVPVRSLGTAPSHTAQKLVDGITEALGIMGLDRLDGLRNVRLEATSYEAAAISGLPLAGFGTKLPMWTH